MNYQSYIFGLIISCACSMVSAMDQEQNFDLLAVQPTKFPIKRIEVSRVLFGLPEEKQVCSADIEKIFAFKRYNDPRLPVSIEIKNIQTKENYRGKGLASLLLFSVLEDIYRQHDGQKVLACVDKNNIPAQRLFDRLNFLKINTDQEIIEYSLIANFQTISALEEIKIKLRDKRKQLNNQ